MHKQEIRRIRRALVHNTLYSSLGFLFLNRCLRSVCASQHLSVRSVHSQIYLHVCKVTNPCNIPHVHVLNWCPRVAGVHAGTAISPRSGEEGWCRGVTNILAAHYQRQHKHRLAASQLLKGVFICVCAWLCVFELRQEEHRRVVPSREVLPSGRRVIT